MNSRRLYIANRIIHLLPDTNCFGLKRTLLRWAGANIGKNVRICSSVSILGIDTLSIGDNTWIGHKTMILCSAPITIGKDCDIAPRTYIGTGTHIIDKNDSRVAGKGLSIPITIGDGVWICVNSVILPGTNIGNKSIIAASSVVKGNVPNYEVWGGCLAKKIKDI